MDLCYLQQFTVGSREANMEAAFRANQVENIKTQMMQVSFARSLKEHLAIVQSFR